MDTITYKDSNKMQDYATHPMFRYFGKLPPTLVSMLMDEYCPRDAAVLDLMCGSGTTLVEAYLRRLPAVGVDVNPLSTLVSQVKTTKIEAEAMAGALAAFRAFAAAPPAGAYTYFRPSTKNLNYWFTGDAQNKLSAIRYFIENSRLWAAGQDRTDTEVRNLLLVTYAGIIRRVSNASPRTGRIFRCAQDSSCDAFEAMASKLQSNILLIQRLPASDLKYKVLLSDARNTGLSAGSFDFILNHPPYFALYKYSSDVLRFELEWLGFDRSRIARQEITDGFKTTDEELLNQYVCDMSDVFKEMRRLMRDGAKACVVVSDSKLREKQLPVVDRLVEAVAASGLCVDSHMLRPVSFAQASYHRSAKPNIRTNEDHVLILKRAD